MHFTPFELARRSFLQTGSLVLTSSAMNASNLFAESTPVDIRIGLVTDLHHADKSPGGTRHYRQTLGKLSEAATHFAAQKLNCLVELGDFIDAADTVQTEQEYLQTVNREFRQICPQRHYVLGNHCVDTLHKAEFLGEVEQEKSYYSFDVGGFHFIVLDACFRSDGQPYGRKNFKWTDANIPPAELEWLAADLTAHQKPTIVFAHQRLDVSNNHGVKNNAAVRKIFENAGTVRAVFQGHSHKNDLKQINGINYCTLVAMVEGPGPEQNGYSVLTLQPNGTIKLDGFRKQADYVWAKTV